MSFGGVALIASGEGDGGFAFSTQALIILAAAITSAIYMILQKHYLGSYSALEFTAYSIWSGTVLMLPVRRGDLVHTLAHRSVAATLAVVYLGMFPGALAMWHGRMCSRTARPGARRRCCT